MDKCPQCNISLPGNPGTSTVHTDTGQTIQHPRQQNGTQPGSGYSQPQYGNGNNNGGTGYSQPSASSMGFIEAVKTCFMKYATFTDRARRSEFWYFVLFEVIVTTLLLFFSQSSDFIGNVYIVWSLGTFLPGLAAYIRRLHDTGRDWKFIFWTFVPVYGQIKLILELAKDSEPGYNWYGPCPK